MLKKVAIKHFGSGAAVGRALGITKGAVSLWPDVIPEGRAYQIESFTKGALKVDPRVYRKRSASKQQPHSTI